MPGLEDIDWAKRVARETSRVVYEASAEIVHVHDETSSQIYRRYFREGAGLARIFAAHRMNFAQFVALLMRSVSGDIAAAVREGALTRELIGIATFRLMQYWGAYRGLRSTDEMTRSLWDQIYYPQSARSAKTRELPRSANVAKRD